MKEYEKRKRINLINIWLHNHYSSSVNGSLCSTNYITSNICMEQLKKTFIFIFVCLGFFFPIKKFSLIWRRHHFRRRVTNFDLHVYLALMNIEQVGFFNVQHILGHGSVLYNAQLRGPRSTVEAAYGNIKAFPLFQNIL